VNKNCPTSEQLRRFLDGELNASENSGVSSHVNTCVDCQSKLETLTSTAWIDSTNRPPSSDVAIESLISRMSHLAPQESSRSSTDEVPQFPGAGDPTSPLGRLNEYRILERIAEGSQGILYLAFDEALRRKVAIKVLRPGLLETAMNAARFEREARMAAALNDERIVRVFQIGRAENFPPYLVMEYVEGHSLRQLIEGQRPKIEDAVRWVHDAAIGLAVAHRAGLIHRDVKPSNLLLDSKTQITRLTDFGLALEAGDASRMTQDGVLTGTPAYMSPEQISRPEQVDSRTDIYSLGVVLYELLAGEVPFRGTLRMTLLQVAHDEPRSPRQLNDQIPRDLETIVLKAMARDPNSRFSSAQEMADELNRWQTGRPILSRPTGQLERVWRWCRRNPGIAALSASTLALLLTLPVVMSVSSWRLSKSARLAEKHATSAAHQRDAAMKVFSELVFKLQEEFEQDEIDFDSLQKNSLQIALDGLNELRRLADEEQLPGLLTAEAFRRMADILVRLNRLDEARDCLIRAEIGFRELQHQPETRVDALQGLVQTFWARHDLELDAETDGTLRKWIEEATRAARMLLEAQPSDANRLLLAESTILEAQSIFDEHESEKPNQLLLDKISESQKLIQPQLENEGTAKNEPLRLWLQAAALLAEYQTQIGEPRQAITALEKALLLLPRDHSAGAHILGPMARLELAYRFRLRSLLLANEDVDAAEAQLKLITEQLETLQEAAVTDSQDLLRTLDLFHDIADDLKAELDLEGVLFFLKQELKLIAARLIRVPGDELTQLRDAESLSELAEVSWELDEPPETVRDAFRRSLERFRQLAGRASFDEPNYFDYCTTLLAWAEFEKSMGMPEWKTLANDAKTIRDQIAREFSPWSAEDIAQIDAQLKELFDEL
jgi:serine/threonine protein kinase